MKYRAKITRLTLMSLGAMFMLIIMLTLSVACMCTITRCFDLVIENQSGQFVTIYSGDDYKIGEADAGEQINYNVPEVGLYHFSAKNSQGEIIYSKEFAFYELEEADWKVVIPPPSE